MLNEYIKPVQFQTIWDGGIEKYVTALLNINTGALMVPLEEIDGLYFKDSISIIIELNGLTSVFDVSEDTGDHYIEKARLSEIQAIYASANKTSRGHWSSNYIESVSSSKVSLEIYECDCGYHASFDTSYLERVDKHASQKCVSCHKTIHTRTETDEVQNRSCTKLDKYTYHFKQGFTEPIGNQNNYTEATIDLQQYTESQIKESLVECGIKSSEDINDAFLAECLFVREISK